MKLSSAGVFRENYNMNGCADGRAKIIRTKKLEVSSERREKGSLGRQHSFPSSQTQWRRLRKMDEKEMKKSGKDTIFQLEHPYSSSRFWDEFLLLRKGEEPNIYSYLINAEFMSKFGTQRGKLKQKCRGRGQKEMREEERHIFSVALEKVKGYKNKRKMNHIEPRNKVCTWLREISAWPCLAPA